jgi:hypothetical protein
MLDAGALAALGLGVLGATLPGRAGTVTATAAVAVVVGIPLARVAWLGVRWLRVGDQRFAAVAVALLAVVGAGVVVAASG